MKNNTFNRHLTFKRKRQPYICHWCGIELLDYQEQKHKKCRNCLNQAQGWLFIHPSNRNADEELL